MTGADLRCECGAGAIDMAPDFPLRDGWSYQWHCANGHLHISGARPGFDGFQQMRFDKPESLKSAPIVE